MIVTSVNNIAREQKELSSFALHQTPEKIIASTIIVRLAKINVVSQVFLVFTMLLKII